jgi:hypothetical protein
MPSNSYFGGKENTYMDDTTKILNKKCTKIVIHFSDGSKETIKRGLVAELRTEAPKNVATVRFHFAGVVTEEVVSIIQATINLAYKYGVFGPRKPIGRL